MAELLPAHGLFLVRKRPLSPLNDVVRDRVISTSIFSTPEERRSLSDLACRSSSSVLGDYGVPLSRTLVIALHDQVALAPEGYRSIYANAVSLQANMAFRCGSVIPPICASVNAAT